MRGALLLSLMMLTASGCRCDRVHQTEGELRVGPPRVDFPRAFVGQTKRAQLEVSNTGLSPRQLTASAPDAPFGAPTETVTVFGASTVALDLTFAPLDAGFYTGTLNLESDQQQQLAVQLTGAADDWLNCAPSNPCRTSVFDLEAGACIEANANEGAECSESNACYAQAHCAAGQCLGTARDCDDHDACSTDICDPARGCVHLAATARCPAPPDPCHVSACDSAAGCIFNNAPDGTRCGPSDCSTAWVCLLGQCKERDVSEGATCGDPSPCQPLGRCVADTCVRPPPAGLTTAWTRWAPPGYRVDWDSIADSQNNVYWRERNPDDQTSQMVSVTNDGVPRFTQPLTGPIQMALVDNVMVVRTASGVEGHRITDGAQLWSVNFNTPDALAVVRTLSRGLGGSLYVSYVRDDAGVLGSVVTSLNVFNGASLWKTQLPGLNIDTQTMPVDENGYAYAGGYQADGNRSRYVGLSPSGAIRWNVVNPHLGPAAVFGGRVYHWDHWISETADGGYVNGEEPTLEVLGFPRLALGAINYVGAYRVDAGNCGAPEMETRVQRLLRVDPATSEVKWGIDIARPDGGGQAITNPVLTSRSTVMFAQNTDYCERGQYVLREVSAVGEPSFSCPLPDDSYFGEGLLAGGKWIAAIRQRDGGGLEGVRAIVLPAGFELPEHGWGTAWGSSFRDNHAR